MEIVELGANGRSEALACEVELCRDQVTQPVRGTRHGVQTTWRLCRGHGRQMVDALRQKGEALLSDGWGTEPFPARTAAPLLVVRPAPPAASQRCPHGVRAAFCARCSAPPLRPAAPRPPPRRPPTRSSAVPAPEVTASGSVSALEPRSPVQESTMVTSAPAVQLLPLTEESILQRAKLLQNAAQAAREADLISAQVEQLVAEAERLREEAARLRSVALAAPPEVVDG